MSYLSEKFISVLKKLTLEELEVISAAISGLTNSKVIDIINSVLAEFKKPKAKFVTYIICECGAKVLLECWPTHIECCGGEAAELVKGPWPLFDKKKKSIVPDKTEEYLAEKKLQEDEEEAIRQFEESKEMDKDKFDWDEIDKK